MEKRIPEVGGTAPDFTALTETGEELTLSRVLANGNNVLLVFYRGHW